MPDNVGIYPFAASTPATPLQLLRILISDDSPTQITGATGTYKYIGDNEATALLTLYTDPRVVAAQIYENVALAMLIAIPDHAQDDESTSISRNAEVMRKIAAGWRGEVAAGAALEDDFLITPTGTDSSDIPLWFQEGAAFPWGV